MRYLLSQYQEKREGAGENTLSFAGCISRYSFGAHRRCLRSSFWHQVCNKRWQTRRGVNTDLRPLSARYGASGSATVLAAAITPTLGSALHRWPLATQSSNHCSRKKSPSKEMQPPSSCRGKAKGASWRICFTERRVTARRERQFRLLTEEARKQSHNLAQWARGPG